MGYTTDFEGAFTIAPPLDEAQAAYLRAFASTRRMARDAAALADVPDPLRHAVGLPVGPEGAFFVNGQGDCGQDRTSDVVAANRPPDGQPSLWCQWAPTEGGAALEWDGAEKFHEYVEWLAYLVDNFLTPWGRTISGRVSWQGEESDDRGVIHADGLRIEAVQDVVTNAGPSWDRRP